MNDKFSLRERAFVAIISVLLLIIAMPYIKKSVEKFQYGLAVKIAYNDFNDALEQLALGAGCPDDLKCTGLFSGSTTDKTFGDKLVKYFKIKKNCGTTPNLGCFAPYTNENYDGSSSKIYQLDEWAGYRFITKNGMAFYVWNYADNCTRNRSYGATGNLKQACGEIYVDTNGPLKGPNYMGVDTWNFWISNGIGATLYPMGGIDTKWSDEDWRWKDPATDAIIRCYPGDKIGWPCAGRVMDEGWQIRY